MNPALFSPIYAPRFVNNIYLDTSDRQFFRDNVAGVASRLKVRIRWYGDVFGFIDSPTLELKIKQGFTGWKESYPLQPLHMEKALERESLLEACTSSNLPLRIVALLESLEPALLNRYRRAYFLSADRLFRITLDSDLSYARLNPTINPAVHSVEDTGLHIVELKYAVSDDEHAARITNSFPFRLSRNSKYVRGIVMSSDFG